MTLGAQRQANPVTFIDAKGIGSAVINAGINQQNRFNFWRDRGMTSVIEGRLDKAEQQILITQDEMIKGLQEEVKALKIVAIEMDQAIRSLQIEQESLDVDVRKTLDKVANEMIWLVGEIKKVTATTATTHKTIQDVIRAHDTLGDDLK